MGKPSLTRLDRQSKTNFHGSKHNLHSEMSSQKTGKSKKKQKRKYQKSIQKLFQHLREDSYNSCGSNCSNTTVINLDDSTVVESPRNHKRKLEDTDENNKKKKHNDTSCVIIKDDDEHNDSVTFKELETPRKKPSPIHCSTPLANKEVKSPNELNLSNLSNNSQTINNNVIMKTHKEITELTKEINQGSFVTIDLTTETLDSTRKSEQNTVIDLVNNTDNQECTFVSVSNASLSMSGDSDVTVLNRSQFKSRNEKKMNKFVNGIAKLNATEKGRLLELITEKIFSGCQMTNSTSNINIKDTTTRATETAEDTFIKEVILGQVPSRNSIGSNIYNPQKEIKKKSGLRMIVIDGSNVAMEHDKGRQFSVKGLKICIDYFLKRGHIVKAFVPRFRCKFGKSSEPRLLDDLERRGLVVYTPSREIQGRCIASYDDRYIVQCAAEFDGVIVSGDNYRDLALENPRWRTVIENRLLPFTWVNDMIMFPRDPLGRNGPSLERFLRHD